MPIFHYWFECCFLHREGKKRWKKEAGHSRLVGAIKQLWKLTRLVLHSRKMRRSLHQPALILKAHKEAIMRFSQVYCPDGLDIFLSQGQGFENSSHCGYREQNIHLKDRGGCEESPVAWVQLMGQAAVMSYGRPSPMCLITGLTIL